jgi:ATP-dependent helicase/nuclease subunit B
MRHELGLDLPERRIGLSAHDFAQLLGSADVILTHSAKVGGAPAVASRFLHRLEAVAGEERWKQAVRAGDDYVRYAGELDQPSKIDPIKQPEPRPPRATRPLKLSVTAIEDWLRDPYTIYAKYILRLDPLDPVDMPLSAADRGSAIHDALGEFTQEFAAALPADTTGELRRIGEKYFAPLMERPEARALWWPRFQRIAAWFANWELARRDNISRIEAEIKGEIEIALDDERAFILSARADRIEQHRAAADRQTDPHGPVAAAHARSGDPARRRLQGDPCGFFRRRTGLCPAQWQQSARRTPITGAEDQKRDAAAAGRGGGLRAARTGEADPPIRQ